MFLFRFLPGVMLAVALLCDCAYTADMSQADFEAMKKKIDDLSKDNEQFKKDNAELRAKIFPTTTKIDQVLDTKYGPNQPVYTRTGKLRIGALTQIWYYGFTQKDNKGLFQDNSINGIQDTNEPANNSSFRIRRTELHFQMDMNENVTSYVIADPARDATGYPNLPNTQGFIKKTNQIAPEFAATGPNGLNATGLVGGVQGGGGSAARILQDAWIDYHDAVPHHDFLVGQVHPWFGEEGLRTSRGLDFCERSQIGFVADSRDIGASIHGAWWDVDSSQGAPYSSNPSGRFQYWISVMDGAGTFHSAGAFQNRPDDNDQKDFGFRMLVRPTWKDHRWGSAELGVSSQIGRHGDESVGDPINNPVNGTNRTKTWASRHDAWGYYAPGGPVKGWWMRGEWSYFNDREIPGTVIDLTGNGNGAGGFAQTNGKPFPTQGWYAATGYKLSDTNWFNDCDCNSLPAELKKFEFAFRYDVFQNVEIADPANNSHTLVFKTQIYTGGINYYIKGHNAKIQFNYNHVIQPQASNPSYVFHQTRDDNFIMNFQVAF